MTNKEIVEFFEALKLLAKEKGIEPEYLIERIRAELKLPGHVSLPVVATGGLAELVLPACHHEIACEANLTLLGLYFIYKATAERESRKK